VPGFDRRRAAAGCSDGEDLRRDIGSLREKHLALLAANGVKAESLRFIARTGASTDVGLWTGGRRVWLACDEARIYLFAAGRRPYFEAIPFAEAGETRYNHIIGQIALGPCQPRVRSLELPPDAGCRFLDVLGIEYGKVVPPGAQGAPGQSKVV
jgi:hypothetical protein